MRIALILACTLAGGCALYTGPSNGDDDGDDALPLPDARFPVDAGRACPAAQQGQITVCGRIYDVETGQPANEGVSIRFFDALAYANGSTADLVPRTLEIDPDGSFIADSLPNTSSGLLAMVVDNVDGDADDRAPTATLVHAYSATQIDHARAYTLRRFTNGTWTNDSGVSGSVLSHNPVLYLYRDVDGPVPGVSVTFDAGSFQTFAFTDQAPEAHHSVTPSGTTGVDGSLLVLWPDVGGGTMDSSGGVGECDWMDEVRGSTPVGTLFVTEPAITCPI